METHEGCGGIIITGSAGQTDTYRCEACGKLGYVQGGIIQTGKGTVKLYSKEEVEKGLPKQENPNI